MKTINYVIVLFVILLGTKILYSSIGIYPEVQKVSIGAKDRLKGNIFVKNSSTETKVYVEVQPEDWSLGRTTNVSWLKIKPMKFWLKPDEIKEIKYKAIVPKGASGDLVAQIFFLPSTKINYSGTISIRTRISSALYVTIKGTEIIDTKIDNFSVIRNLDNYDFLVGVKNNGNVHVSTKGKIIFSNKDTGETKEIIIKDWSLRARESFPIHNWMENVRLTVGNYESVATIIFIDPSGEENEITSIIQFTVDDAGNISNQKKVEK